MKRCSIRTLYSVGSVLVCLSTVLQLCDAGRILAVIPIPSYSHQIPYRALWKTLSERGHEVVVLTTNPVNDKSVINLTEINFEHNYEHLRDVNFLQLRLNSVSWFDIMRTQLWEIGHKLAHNIFKHPEVQKMYVPTSGVEFDVVIAEVLLSPACYALAHRFDAPLIGISSLGLYSVNHYLLGDPVLPSHPSSWEMEGKAGFNLPFLQRLKNYIEMWWFIHDFVNDFMAKQHQIAEHYLGSGLPSLVEMEKHMSMVFVNQQEAISFIRPTLPNMLPFGNFHIAENPTPLPQELKDFIDNASECLIYVSFGTNVKISTSPERIQGLLLEVFSELPCGVLWKYDANITRKPDNVFIMNWFPQQSVLAHPKTRLFFYQGGLQSTEEAVHFGVPLVGMPILADQEYQVHKMVHLGVAKRVDISTMTKEEVKSTLQEVLNDKTYKERMLEVREILQTKPHNPLDNAVWWTEFIMQHKGAPHLHCSISEEPWYQRYDIDVIAFLSIAVFVSIILFLTIISQIFVCICKRYIFPSSKAINHKKMQ